MKKIKVSVSTNYIQCKTSTVIEVEDNATKDEIAELALDAVNEMVDIDWHELEDGEEE